MFKKIAVPVDLAHSDKLGKALGVAADLAKHYGASVHVIGVTATVPTPVAHNPKEYADKLAAFAAHEANARGVSIEAHATTSNDPVRELDDALDAKIHELGADLVIMASHIPHFREYVFASNAGFLAGHTDVSVFVVR